MRAIQIRCPNCAATIDVVATALTITCTYCQTQSRIRPRTQFLETPVKLPPQPQLDRLPVAVQQHSGRWVAGLSFTILLFVGLMSAVPFCIIHKVRQHASGFTGHDGTTGRTLNWGSWTPIAADVSGDGVADLLGRLRGLEGHDSVHLVAFDGASGKKLWQSPNLGTYSETYQGTVAMLGDQLLFVSDRGLARGYSTEDGSELWKVNILEKLQSACTGGDAVYLFTADERWIKLDTSTGKAVESPAPAACKALATDGRRDHGRELIEIDTFNRSEPRPQTTDGMQIGENLVVEGNHRLGVGVKSPGTRVPMVARYEVTNWNPPPAEPELEIPDKELGPKQRRARVRERRARERELYAMIQKAEFEFAWKSVVPSRDPLGAKTSAPEHIGLSLDADCVVVSYEMRDKPIHVACLSYKTGEHRWDVAMPKAFIDSLDGLAVSKNRAFLSMSSRVHVIDLATGERLFTVGQNN
jgi:outer membrane protein assembly factor BamB